MSVRGLKDSALYDKALRGDNTKLTIGAPIITNDRRTMSEPVRLLVQNDTLTEPLLNQIEAFGVDGLVVGRDDRANRLTFNEQVDVNARRIVEAAFDARTGELVLVRANKEELRLPDFLRIDQAGRGPTGPRGPRGKDGKNGRNGREGKKGETGCQGPVGKPGTNGEPGVAGKQGAIGRQGPQGCEGATGDMGPRGPQGPHGFEGARGLTGPSCGSDDSNRGTAGPAGKSFGEGVFFGTTATAGPTVAIVGLADDGIDSTVGVAAPTPKPPVTSVPVVPPPQPAPDAGPGTVTLCSSTTRLGDVKRSCGSNVNAWSNSFIYPGANGPNGSKGISLFYKANNTAWWPNSLVLCSSFTQGASYTVELTTPGQVSAQLFVNCAVSLVSEGGTTRTTFVANTANTSLRVRFYGQAQKIPVWFAVVIKNAAGTIVYKSGQSPRPGKIGNVSFVNDLNWYGNSATQYIGAT